MISRRTLMGHAGVSLAAIAMLAGGNDRSAPVPHGNAPVSLDPPKPRAKKCLVADPVREQRAADKRARKSAKRLKEVRQ